jgi:hypothetical protein
MLVESTGVNGRVKKMGESGPNRCRIGMYKRVGEMNPGKPEPKQNRSDRAGHLASIALNLMGSKRLGHEVGRPEEPKVPENMLSIRYHTAL